MDAYVQDRQLTKHPGQKQQGIPGQEETEEKAGLGENDGGNAEIADGANEGFETYRKQVHSPGGNS